MGGLGRAGGAGPSCPQQEADEGLSHDPDHTVRVPHAMNQGIVPLVAFGAATAIAVIWMLISVSALKQRAMMCDDCWSDVVHDLGQRHELRRGDEIH